VLGLRGLRDPFCRRRLSSVIVSFPTNPSLSILPPDIYNAAGEAGKIGCPRQDDVVTLRSFSNGGHKMKEQDLPCYAIF